MPIAIVCPKCEGKLRVNDTLLGKKVKCPKCQTIFPANPAEEEEEVVEEIEEEEEERPRKPARRRDEDDDEDDRPRKKRARDDEDDDEDDDRPRKKRRRDDDDDDDEDRYRKAGNPKGELKSVRMAALLMFIGSIITLAAIGLSILLVILGISDAWYPPYWALLIMVVLPGMGGTGTFLTGLIFGILGPKKGAVLGMSIASTAACALYLLFTIICLAQQRPEGATFLRHFTTMVGHGRFGGFDAIGFFGALFEVATLVLFYLWCRFLMLYYKRGAGVALSIAGICVTGGAAVFLLLLGIIQYNVGGQVMFWVGFVMQVSILPAVWVVALLQCLTLKSFLEYQKPK